LLLFISESVTGLVSLFLYFTSIATKRLSFSFGFWLALKHINAMKKGDLAFFYHSGDEKQIVGIMEIASAP
jgi:hypothetical protein